MLIVKANTEHVATIKRIAAKSWASAYSEILSQDQISYMLDMMYSDAALKQQMTEQRHFFFLVKANEQEEYIGFVSCEVNHKHLPKTKIHKLYVLPQYQETGLGKALIKKVEEVATNAENYALVLNVNRFNKALGFYKKLGFVIVGEEDIDIGQGFVMEDYILEKKN